MFASLLQAKSNTLIIDSNKNIGAKIAISGGGKCNLTNEIVSSDNYLGIEWFVQSVLSRFDEQQVLEWFAGRGLELIVRKDGQYFCENSANDIIDIFKREVVDTEILLDTKVIDVHKENGLFAIKSNKGMLYSESLVVASGGLSFPRLGASSIGLDIAKSFGHTTTVTAPALVGFTLQSEQLFFKELSGSSVFVSVSVDDKVHSGDMLFAHRGISGPAILNASLYWEKGNIEIDFLPNFSLDSIKGSKKQLSTLLPLPKKVAKAFLDYLGVTDRAAEKVSTEELGKLKVLQNYSFAPAGTFGYSKAEVTRGGVVADEVDPYNMMSLKEANLYFIGEVLDVTGELGGYNFQWAFSSAFACANSFGDDDA
ncbi:MAG: aminoacetone oxidase family FAD-binding enzyme [Sulfurovum sp.]|nr:aminoacetone oxidase family FAD-binding enzyme [Sulfurovum sp.]